MARRRMPAFLFSSLEEQLRVRPIRNVRVVREPGPEPGQAVLRVELKYGRLRWIAKWFKTRSTRSYIVDGVALALYDRMDGQATLGDLMAWMMREYALTFFEARGLLINFVHPLIERGLIVVVGTPRPIRPDAPDDAEGSPLGASPTESFD